MLFKPEKEAVHRFTLVEIENSDHLNVVQTREGGRSWLL